MKEQVLLGLVLLMAATAGRAAFAGPHARGVVVPHLNPRIEYTASVSSYEGQSELRDCREAITQGEISSESAQVWFVMAAFKDSPGPVELGGAEFGFAGFDASRLTFVGYGACNSFLEISSDGWPGPRQGTAIVFRPPRRSDPVELYWFASYVYGPVSIELSVNPMTDMATFSTSDTPPPPEMDEIWDFGIMGFGQPGYNPCGNIPAEGACCIWGDCRIMTRDDCESQGGSYKGDRTDCFPTPCGQVIETTWGTLKRMYE